MKSLATRIINMKEEPSNDHDKTSKDGDVCGGACSKVLKILGLHNSSSPASSSSKIREVFDDDVGKMSMRQVIKILVLGPGDSGKSTVLKQIGLINGNNYTDSEKLKFKPTIIRNILDSLLSLQNAMNTFSLNFEDANNEENMECLVECRKRIAMDNMDDWNENCESYLPKMKSIWADPSIRMCLERRNLFYLSDSID